MSNQRKSLLALLCYAALIFVLGWSKSGISLPFVIQPFVLVILFFAVASVFVIPHLERVSLYVPAATWTGVYLYCKIISLPGVQLDQTGLAALPGEVLMLLVGIYLARDFAHQMHLMETTVEELSFPAASQRVKDLEEAMGEIQVEFARSRRHGRELSVIVIDGVTDQLHAKNQKLAQFVQANLMKRLASASLAEAIEKEVRRSDLVVKKNTNGKNQFIVLCPETNAEGTELLAERIHDAIYQDTGLSVNYGLASFPEEALTFEDLCSQAENEMSQTRQQTSFFLQKQESKSPEKGLIP